MEAIEERLMKFKKEGETLSYNRFQRKHPKLFHAALYYFGSWGKALAVVKVASAAIYFFGSWEESINRAGLDYESIRKRRKESGALT